MFSTMASWQLVVLCCFSVQADGDGEASSEKQIGNVSEFAFSKTGMHLATADLDGPVSLWDLTSLKKLRSIDNPNYVSSLGFSSNGNFLAAVTSEKDRIGLSTGAVVRIWSANEAKVIH